jgi:hypothetical protein
MVFALESGVHRRGTLYFNTPRTSGSVCLNPARQDSREQADYCYNGKGYA